MFGKTFSEEHCAKISKANTGKKHSEETRAKISKSHIGKKHSEETCAKISVATSGENNPMFGKKQSEKWREKMRAAVSAAHKGAHWFNNGVECRCCRECPGDGWQRGRLRNKQSQQ